MSQNELSLVDRLLQEKTNRPATNVVGTVKDWYQKNLGAELPVHALGATEFHRKIGFEHSRSFDVGLNPNSPNGQKLIQFLESQGIPYIAFSGAVPGKSTGPHIHVGPPSRSIANESLVDRLLKQKQSTVRETQVDRRGAYGDRAARARQALKAQDAAMEKLARDVEWHFGYGVLQALPTLPVEKQREILEKAHAYAQEDEVKKKKGIAIIESPAWKLRNQQLVGVVEGKDIEARTRPEVDAAQRAAFSAGANPLMRLPNSVRLAAESLISGAGGIMEFGSGLADLIPTDPLERRSRKGGHSLVGELLARKAQEARSMAAESQEASGRGPITRIAQGVGTGLVEFAPVAAIPISAVPSIMGRIGLMALSGGAYSGTQAVGRGETEKGIARETGTGAATFALLGVPLPGKNVLRKAFSNLVITGGGATVISKATGAPWDEAAVHGLVLTLMRSPELIGRIRVRQPNGKERPATIEDIKALGPERQLGSAKFELETVEGISPGKGTVRLSESTARENLKTLQALKESPTWKDLSKGQKEAIDNQIKRLEEQGAKDLLDVPRETSTRPPAIGTTRELLEASPEKLNLLRKERAVLGREPTQPLPPERVQEVVDSYFEKHKAGEGGFIRFGGKKAPQLDDLYHDRRELGGLLIKPKVGQKLEPALQNAESIRKALRLPKGTQVAVDMVDDTAIVQIFDAAGKRNYDAELKLARSLQHRFVERPEELGSVDQPRSAPTETPEFTPRPAAALKDLHKLLDEISPKTKKRDVKEDILEGVQDLGDIDAPRKKTGEEGFLDVGEIVKALDDLRKRFPKLSDAQLKAKFYQEYKEKIKPEFSEGIEQRHAGIPFLEKIFGARQAPDSPKAPSSVSAEVEARMKAAEGIQPPGVIAKTKDALRGIYASFKRTYPEIDPNKNDVNAVVNDIFRQHEAAPAYAKAVAFNRIAEITENLGRERLKVFSRVIQLPDILKDIQEGRYKDKKLPFGYKNESEVLADLRSFERVAQETPAIADALKRREKFVKELTQQLVDLELLSPEVLKDSRYYHRQVMAYVNDPAWVGTGSGDIRLHQKGFQKARVGGGDFNTRYQEAEFEWVSQALALIQRKQTLAAVQPIADIKPDLEVQAKLTGQKWQDLIPETHEIWQPKEGGHFYPALTIAERTMNKVLSGTKLLERADVKRALAMGRRFEQWVVPKEIAKTMDDFRPIRDEGPIERAWTKIQSTWKQWTLLSPMRVLRYNLNNISGDLDIALAYSPKIARGMKSAAQDLWRYQVRGKTSPEIEEAIKRGVVDSGLSLTEIPDINKAGAFRTLVSTNSNVIQHGIQAYWGGVRNFTAWRENILRLTAYRHFRQELAQGKRVYGASTKEQIDAVLRERGPDAAAAKLARELVGDYGAVSPAGRWARRHLIPFYSWIEINAPRYVRLLRNLPHEGKSSVRGAGAIAGKVATKGAGLVLKANLLMLAAQLWNHTMFPEEEKQLLTQGREPHIILGKGDDGSIRTLRLSGALADALEWFSLADYPRDIYDLATGKKTLKAQVAETVEAPPTKFVQALEPVAKTTFEVATGKSTYPTLFESGEGFFDFRTHAIRDRKEYAARVLGLDELYRRITGRPHPPTGPGSMLDLLLTRRTDPGEAAYWEMRGKASDWAKKQGRTITGGEPTERSNALYYFRQATKWKDEEAAKRWLREYKRLGGTAKGMKQSLRMGHPMGMLNKKDDKAFEKSLSPEDKLLLEQAIQWYTNTYGKPGAANKLLRGAEQD